MTLAVDRRWPKADSAAAYEQEGHQGFETKSYHACLFMKQFLLLTLKRVSSLFFTREYSCFTCWRDFRHLRTNIFHSDLYEHFLKLMVVKDQILFTLQHSAPHCSHEMQCRPSELSEHQCCYCKNQIFFMKHQQKKHIYRQEQVQLKKRALFLADKYFGNVKYFNDW